jgi:hypothetical protein
MSNIFKRVAQVKKNISNSQTIKKTTITGGSGSGGKSNTQKNEEKDKDKEKEKELKLKLSEIANEKNPRILFYPHKLNFNHQYSLIYKATFNSNDSIFDFEMKEKYKNLYLINLLITTYLNFKLGILLCFPLIYYRKEIKNFPKFSNLNFIPNFIRQNFKCYIVKEIYISKDYDKFSILDIHGNYFSFYTKNNELFVDYLKIKTLYPDIDFYDKIIKEYFFIRNNIYIFAIRIDSIIYNKEFFGNFINGRTLISADFKWDTDLQIAGKRMNHEKMLNLNLSSLKGENKNLNEINNANDNIDSGDVIFSGGVNNNNNFLNDKDFYTKDAYRFLMDKKNEIKI